MKLNISYIDVKTNEYNNSSIDFPKIRRFDNQIDDAFKTKFAETAWSKEFPNRRILNSFWESEFNNENIN